MSASWFHSGVNHPNALVFDAWTPMSFKKALGGRSQGGTQWTAPSWVGNHERRLLAYRILQAYVDNSARVFLQSTDQTEIDNHREYGDAPLIVNQVVSALLGDEQTIVVPGADDYRNPDDLDGDVDEADLENTPEAEAAWNLQEWLQQWAKDERLALKVIEVERNAVSLGDGVYTLGWNEEKDRPPLRVFDPGFYFPVLDDGPEDDFPKKVHIAWELEPELGSTVRKVRRITWELAPIRGDEPGPLARVLGAEVKPLDGDTLEADGRISRQHPWNKKPSFVTCYLSDGTWTLGEGDNGINDLDEGNATWTQDSAGEVRNRDLLIDFLPVVHVPNTVSLANHYGRSTLSAVLQILDDLANADTDLSAASSTAGRPVLALSKATMGDQRPTYKPGEILETGDGTATILDTSRALDAIIKYIEFLLKRLSVNARLPESVLGRVDPGDVPSGVALALSFGPLTSMVAEMRLVRSEKYPLLLKFAHRLAVAGGAEGVPLVFEDAELRFGSYLPSDTKAAVDLVVGLLSNKACSLETAVAILMEAGLPIADLIEEVSRIEGRDFEGAEALFAALGSEDEVWDYLNRDKPAEPVRPSLMDQAAMETAALDAAADADPEDTPSAASGQVPPVG